MGYHHLPTHNTSPSVECVQAEAGKRETKLTWCRAEAGTVGGWRKINRDENCARANQGQPTLAESMDEWFLRPMGVCCCCWHQRKRIAALYRQARLAGDRPLKEEGNPAQAGNRSVIKNIMCQQQQSQWYSPEKGEEEERLAYHAR